MLLKLHYYKSNNLLLVNTHNVLKFWSDTMGYTVISFVNGTCTEVSETLEEIYDQWLSVKEENLL